MTHTGRVVSVLAGFWALVVWWALGSAVAAQWTPIDSTAENDAIRYSTTTPTDAIARLQRQIDAGLASLEFDDRSGYLPSLLRALTVPSSSQMLVFSKTSFQRDLISPMRPRALYFGDSVYVGSVPGSPILEVASIDPQLGAVFYTLRQGRSGHPTFQRETQRCLQCHDSPALTAGVPGLIMRSVHADATGEPILAAGTYVTTDRSPLSERWGGWYVTGSSGGQSHMGAELPGTLETASYLTPRSDVVALMVFEHQKQIQNLITRLNHRTRLALTFDRLRPNDPSRGPDDVSSDTSAVIRREGEPLVQAMLLVDEAPIIAAVAGSSGFAADFVRLGPRDRAGHSLRDLDLTRRLFRYPCSYLIYSEAFNALPAPAKRYVYRRLWEVLSGEDQAPAFQHLSRADRAAILDILLDTQPEFAESHHHV